MEKVMVLVDKEILDRLEEKIDNLSLKSLQDSKEKPISAEDVAEQFGIAKNTVYKWAREGIIPSHSIGGYIFFFRGEILEHSRRKAVSDVKEMD